MFWVLQILYKCTINLTKASILLLYLGFFRNWVAVYSAYAVLGYVASYALASIIATVLECTPVPHVWDHTIPGTCINLTAFWYANAISNIASDLVILALPWPVILKLNMRNRQKYTLGLVFMFGGL